MKNKKFDCVEMMHEGQRAVRKQLEGMTVEQKIEFWRQRGEEMRADMEKSKRKKAAAR